MSDICSALRRLACPARKVSLHVDSSLEPVSEKAASRQTHPHSAGTGRNETAEDLHLATPVRKLPLKLSLDTFVVGSRNQLAYNAALSVVTEQKSPFNPLFFHGGYGIGKTHLLQGICNEMFRSRPLIKWLYISAEDFANQYVLSLKTRKLDFFRARFRQLDLLAIDDIHFLSNKNAMQEEFLHTFNTIDLAGKQVILGSDAHPKMIGQLCDRLVNRFVSGMVIKIEPPDFETRCRICHQRAKVIGHTIPNDVIEYVSDKITTNVRELEGALLKLIAFASLDKEAINITMAHQVLAEHISRSDPIVHISDITTASAEFFGVTTENINSSLKDRTISLARAFCMYLARRYTKMSYPEIGRLIGNKNHATVILATRKIEQSVKLNSDIKWQSSTGCRIVPARSVLEQISARISR